MFIDILISTIGFAKDAQITNLHTLWDGSNLNTLFIDILCTIKNRQLPIVVITCISDTELFQNYWKFVFFQSFSICVLFFKII